MANEVEGTDALSQGLRALQSMIEAAAEQGKQKKPDKAFANIQAGVTYEGSKLILPSEPRRMQLNEARDVLARLEQQENTQVRVIEPIKDVHPFDGAVAFMKALQQVYGWASPVPEMSFFGPQPPVTISIETSPEETAVIFWGAFRVPGLGDTVLACSVDASGKRPVFQIVGVVLRKYVEAIHGLAELARQIARESSIYRGQALTLAVNGGGQIDWNLPPTFINLKRIKPQELVFSESVTDEVQTNLWTLIEHTERCRTEGVPLKRGVLFEGPYGTGKTMAASITAKLCVEHNWTFITVPKAAALEPALHFASAYQPCVLFIEDIDREIQGERDVEMDAILNTVDGIISKGAEIIVCFTSNHAKLINRAMLRPGRLDSVIHMAEPDAPAVQKLLRVYGRKLIKKDEDLTAAGEALAGRIPAVIRECVERSKLYAISRSPKGEFHITADDIVRAAKGMAPHLAMLEDAPPSDMTPAETMAKALVELISKPVREKIDAIDDRLDTFANHFGI